MTGAPYMPAHCSCRSIQQAVQLGLPVLIENVGETIEPFLDPLLLHQVREDRVFKYA
jgi:hypothetical protein